MNTPDLVQQRVDEILADERFDEESASISRTEAIEALINEFGWESVRESMFDLLRDDSRAKDWREALHVFWGAVLDGRALPKDKLVAWLYYRFDPDGKAEDNEVWSITSKLKGKGYLSKYKPLEDPNVLKHLQAIRVR